MDQETPNEQYGMETAVSAQPIEAPRRAYNSPKITAYGTLADLTRAGWK